MGSDAADGVDRRPHPHADIILLAVATGILLLDQATKWWVLRELGDGHAVHIVGSLQLQITRNPGSAFSMGTGSGPIIGVIAAAVVGCLVWFGRRQSDLLAVVAVALVLGGATGNLTDRATRGHDGFLSGHVIDFVDAQWWPVFNLADSAVVIGGALLVLHGMQTDDRDEPEDDTAGAAQRTATSPDGSGDDA